MGALDDGRFDGELEDGAFLGLDGGAESGTDKAESTRAIEDAVKILLEGLGEDPERDGLKKTPHRVARAFRAATKGYAQNVNDIVQGALFPEAGLENGTGFAGGVGGLVVVRDIYLFSYCVSCLLPFRIKCHVGYIPSRKRVLGLSKLSRVADVFAKRIQDPQTLADDVCSALNQSIRPAGVAVALQCWHIGLSQSLNCNSHSKYKCDEDSEDGIRVSVCSSSGLFKGEKSSSWDDFLALLKLKGITIKAALKNHSLVESWCPLMPSKAPLSNGNIPKYLQNGWASAGKEATKTKMIDAVASLMQLLGEDISRSELAGTPQRFVEWMMNFKKPVSERKLMHSDLTRINLDQKNGGECLRELNLPFCSLCEHHLLPFHGIVHIGYFPHLEGANMVERSALQSLVYSRSSRLQVQERLTRQIAEAVYSVFDVGVIVVLEANHICMVSRGVEKIGSSTATIAVMGRFSTDPAAKASFLEAIAKQRSLVG